MATTLTSSLIVRLIDNVSRPAQAISRNLLGLNSQVRGGFGARLTNAMQQNERALNSVRGRLLDAGAGFFALQAAIASPVRAAMDFESAMADVLKVVDFPTPQAFTDFQQQLLDLSTRVPLAVNGLAEIAAAAGQAGIAGEDLVRFTEAAAKIGVAFGISADEAGGAMARLMTGLGMSIDEAVLLADAMNHLSNSQASDAAEILDVVRRVGAQAQTFGFTAEQVAAFGSAMVSAGAETEVAATSFRNMGNALTRGASATRRQREAYRRLGLDATEVARVMQEDAVGTTLDVMERIAELPADLRAAISSDLFGNEARALGPLLTNLDLLRQSLGLVEDQSNYAGSSFREFEVRAETFASSLQAFRNRLTALGIAVGMALMPKLEQLMETLEPVIQRVTEFAQAHPEVISNVLIAAGAVVAFKAALAGLTFVGLLGRGGALALLAGGFNTVGRAIIFARDAARGGVALDTALAGLQGLKLGPLDRVVSAISGIARAVPGVTGVARGFSAISMAMGGVSILRAGVWGAVIAGVAAAGVMLWKYWDRVTSVVGGFLGRLGELASEIPGVKPVLESFASVGRTIGEGWNFAMGKLREFGNWIGSFFQQEVLTEEEKAAWSQVGYDVADRMINSIKQKIAELVDWFKGLGQMVLDAIGSIDIGSLIQIPDIGAMIQNRLGEIGIGGAAPATNADGSTRTAPGPTRRAYGGPVTRGSSVLVGDGGEPELFTPPGNGRITPLSQLGGGGRPISIGQLIIQEASSAQATARAVTDELNRLARGAHSDSEAWA